MSIRALSFDRGIGRIIMLKFEASVRLHYGALDEPKHRAAESYPMMVVA